MFSFKQLVLLAGFGSAENRNVSDPNGAPESRHQLSVQKRDAYNRPTAAVRGTRRKQTVVAVRVIETNKETGVRHCCRNSRSYERLNRIRISLRGFATMAAPHVKREASVGRSLHYSIIKELLLFRKVVLILLGLVALAVTAGCNPNVLRLASQESDKVVGNNEALLIVGNHSDARLGWGRVTVDESNIARPVFNQLSIHDGNKSRFTVWKVGNLERARTVGLTGVGVGTRNFEPCGDALMPIMSLAPGEVVYVGDFKYQMTDKKLTMQWSFDTEAATNSVKEQWSVEASSRMTERRLDFAKTTALCGEQTIITIPIYLPRR